MLEWTEESDPAPRRAPSPGDGATPAGGATEGRRAAVPAEGAVPPGHASPPTPLEDAGPSPRPPPGSRGPVRLALSRVLVMVAAAGCLVAIFHTALGRGGRSASRDARDPVSRGVSAKALRKARGGLPEAPPPAPPPPPGAPRRSRPVWGQDGAPPGPPPWSVPEPLTAPAATSATAPAAVDGDG